MTRKLMLVAAVAAALAVAVPAIGATPKLTGAVGPGSTITLKRARRR